MSLAWRIALACLLVVAVATAVIATGVLVLGQRSFEQLMAEHGAPVAEARQMFAETVTAFFVAGVAAAALASAALAILLSRRISAPLARLSAASRAIAAGDLRARVPREGPRELVSLTDSFNTMAERLEGQERLREEFVVNAAHELRTPLTNLRGYLEALRDGVIEPGRETFESLHEEVERLVRLSRSLDALAEGDLRARPPELREIDLAAAIDLAVELVQPAFEGRGIAWEVRTPRPLRARANPDHVAQVLANLLQNATRYTPQGGRVSVSASARPADAVVSVTNTGDGIPAADLPHVFERFFRVERSRDRARGGAGIGLAIVKQLVELNGGQVGAGSTDGTTRFWFSLPAPGRRG
jgi:signal transduction histidine kinase